MSAMTGKMKHPRTCLCALIVPSLVLWLACGPERSSSGFNRDRAEVFMESYVAALRSGDLSEIRSHWSRDSLERPGFETMHLWVGATIHITQWAEFLEDSRMTYSIRQVRSEDGYHVIEFDWVPEANAREPSQSASHGMRYYVIPEDGDWLLTNPIDVLTRGWNQHEGEHLVVYCPAEIDIAKHLAEIDFVDTQCGKMLDALDLSLERKIEYYKVASPHQCGELVCFPPANGYAAIQLTNDATIPQWFDLVVSTSFDNAHEVMHVLASKAKIPYVSAAFCEGLAVAYGGTTLQTPDLALTKTKTLVGTPAYVPLASLLTMPDADFLRASYVTYQEAGAFVRFLIDTFGIAKVRRLYDEIVATDDVSGAARGICGCAIDTLETMLHAYLEAVEVLDVDTTIPDESQLVFVMADPAGDDRGDGDYTYPSDDRFCEGAFDLREFAVLRDSDRVYFRLGLASLIEPVGYTSGGERFMPGAVIAMKRGDEAEGHLTRSCHGIEFEEAGGFDLKVAVGFGVCIADSFGKVVSTTGDISERILKKDSSSMEFSVPIATIGEPDGTWSYFVGIGLMSDRAMDFFGGPVPVVMESSTLIGGGNARHGNPAFIDVLLPPNVDQTRLLSAYDAVSGRLASVPMVRPGL
jgi:hypothetical protein